MKPTREQIIDLINQYIYTNGRQRITAIQLNEILTLIANSFELVGQGTGGGINQVLNTDPNVENNQKIINKNGGRLDLSGTIDVTDEIRIPYMGLLTGVEGNKPDPKDPDKGYQFGAVVSNQMATVVGNSIGINPFEYLDQQKNISPLDKLINIEKEREKEERRNTYRKAQNVTVTESATEQTKDPKSVNKLVSLKPMEREDPRIVGALSLYLPDNLSLGGKEILKRGVYSGLVHNYTQNILQIQEERIQLSVVRNQVFQSGEEMELEARIEVGGKFIEQEISYDRSDNSAYEVLYLGAKEFSFNRSRTLSIDIEGLRFDSRKRLAYNTDPSSGTAGVAKLVSGSVLVNTTAIKTNSYVMLTVQNSGEFQGNIRVSEKTAGSGFRISSTNNTDNCQVLWQIIDLDY